jgi:hypothetical protein
LVIEQGHLVIIRLALAPRVYRPATSVVACLFKTAGLYNDATVIRVAILKTSTEKSYSVAVESQGIALVSAQL